MKSLAAIHVAKKQLAMEDADYRGLLNRVTGKSSAGDLSEPQRQAVLEEFRRLGFKGGSKGGRKPLEGRYAKKLQALWIAAWNLGLVRDRDDRALTSFVKRQTGIDAVRFLRHEQNAMKAIEALKGWMARAAGVDWRTDRHTPEFAKRDGYKVAHAQVALIVKAEGADGFGFATLTGWLLKQGLPPVNAMSDADWREAMNCLGERVRSLKGGAR